jgi:hypothetical protein
MRHRDIKRLHKIARFHRGESRLRSDAIIRPAKSLSPQVFLYFLDEENNRLDASGEYEVGSRPHTKYDGNKNGNTRRPTARVLNNKTREEICLVLETGAQQTEARENAK